MGIKWRVATSVGMFALLVPYLLAADVGKPNLRETARTEQPGFLVRASVNRASRSYREGDVLYVNVVSEKDAYVYALYQQADGAILQIFPNRVQPENRVKAGQSVQIPAADDLFRWVVGPPFGQEVIKVVASEKPIENLETEVVRRRRFTPVPGKQLKDLDGEVDAMSPAEWTESDIEVFTYARGQTAKRHGTRRFGVFFGVSKYKYNAEYEASRDGKHKLDLFNAHHDAQKLAEIFREVSRLDDVRVYVNELATRRQLEVAVTDWLPSVSQPGDTVFIFFTGHGVKIKDDNGDEADGLDEALTPHDIVGPGILSELKKKMDRGERVDAGFDNWLSIARQAGSESDDVYAALIRETGVSDDLFAHWLQRLDGRRVVVILGTCHSGGFATVEKGGEPPVQSFSFDFLDSEFSRLKDIGQTDQAMLAAAFSQQVSLDVHAMGMSVMPYFLAQSIKGPGGVVTLDEGHQFCKAAMAAFYEKFNQKRQEAGQELVPVHQPYLVNHCTEDVYLKP